MAWEKGQSGNPAGRRVGSGRVAQLRALLEPHAEGLIQKAAEMALAGDSTAMRLCLERLVPPLKSADLPVQMELPEGPLTQKAERVLAAVAAGEVTPDEAAAVLGAIAAQARIAEADELERRIRALEARNGPGK
jgi:hypothetical protein